MPSPLIPQEIYLLERYITLEYFGEMRDAWDDMVKHAEACLDEYTRNLPPDYRSRPLPEQPDVTWGEIVLPNFRSMRAALFESYIKLSHGDMNALRTAHGVRSDITGQQRDYSPFWMTDEQQVKYYALMGRASEHATNIGATVGATWKIGGLTTRYNPKVRGPLAPPPQWPAYRLNPAIKAITGQPVPRTGIYLPEIDNSCAAFMIEGEEAVEACIGFDPGTMQYVSREPTTWTLVERLSETEAATVTPAATYRGRCEAGDPCPLEGYWFTPAKSGSRRHFKQGETMPDFGSRYGKTIWQWDENQG